MIISNYQYKTYTEGITDLKVFDSVVGDPQVLNST
jgi:hypothetical protein